MRSCCQPPPATPRPADTCRTQAHAHLAPAPHQLLHHQQPRAGHSRCQRARCGSRCASRRPAASRPAHPGRPASTCTHRQAARHSVRQDAEATTSASRLPALGHHAPKPHRPRRRKPPLGFTVCLQTNCSHTPSAAPHQLQVGARPQPRLVAPHAAAAVRRAVAQGWCSCCRSCCCCCCAAGRKAVAGRDESLRGTQASNCGWGPGRPVCLTGRAQHSLVDCWASCRTLPQGALCLGAVLEGRKSQ